ncbi:hypothetical protein JNJ66_00995 [Candidatus Saccharibacteria bacterium]|nr:hypothetical protein [Candidatus Saccharibacteria bacterium]
MDIFLNTHNGHVMSGPQLITCGQRHPLDSEHDFIIELLGTGQSRKLHVKIMQGSKRVKRAMVPLLSGYAGRKTNGNSRHRKIQLRLDPARPIFPIKDVVDALLAAGIEWYQISPMHADSALDDCTARRNDPRVATDGDTCISELEPEGDLFARRRFEVTGATWAIVYHGTTIEHVYLWDGAEDHLQDILEAVTTIRSGTVSV